MRFLLLDKITQIEPGQSLSAEKLLDGSEEYLQDHFPNFPCMPGVLMLEAMYQAAAWLLRQSDDFARPIVMLKEASNVKYGNFVGPGQTLTVEVKVTKQVDDNTYKVKGQGTVDGKPAVSGILLLDQFSYAERYPIRSAMDATARREYMEVFRRLYAPAAVANA